MQNKLYIVLNLKTKIMKTKEKTYTEFTPIGKTYWNDEGVYQTEFDELYKYLVPNCGDAPTVQGELLRVISRLNYDYFNNGNCNVQEVIYDSDGIYWEEVVITEYYQRMIDFLYKYSNAYSETQTLENFLTSLNNYSRKELFCDKNEQIYTRLIDKVMQQILTDGKDANKPNPEFNEKA
tara:strand:- start:36 stop:572 length:537 start_codon:yes stop_codon:yes gene_type:complete